jgi:hypothetical protein
LPREAAAWRARLSPELLAVGVILVTGLAVLSSSLIPPPSSASRGGPNQAVQPSFPQQSQPPVDVADIQLLLQLNQLIEQSAGPLRDELERKVLDTLDVRAALTKIVSTTGVGLDPAQNLQQRPRSRAAGEHAERYYRGLRAIADTAFEASLANQDAHRRAASRMLTALDEGKAIDKELEALLALAEATPTPPPTASPQPSPSPSPPPSTMTVPPSQAASASPPPSAQVSTGTAAGELVVNGGFESGSEPWRLLISDAAAQATASIDRTGAAAGSASLRVDIAAGSESRSGVSVQQGGLHLAANTRYVARLVARAASDRDIAVTVRGSDGTIPGGRVFSVGTDWTELNLAFTTLTADANATLEIDLGRSAATVWLDSVSLAPSEALAGG